MGMTRYATGLTSRLSTIVGAAPISAPGRRPRTNRGRPRGWVGARCDGVRHRGLGRCGGSPPRSWRSMIGALVAVVSLMTALALPLAAKATFPGRNGELAYVDGWGENYYEMD